MSEQEYRDLLDEIATSTPEGRRAIAERLNARSDNYIDGQTTDDPTKQETWRDRAPLL